MGLMQTPRYIDIEITDKCNLRCKYCSHFSSPGNTWIDIAKEEWMRFFDELNRCAVLKVTLSGGEPFYREDLPELIQGIVSNQMRFNLLSNGTLITEELASFLASTHRCDEVQISIDGSIPTTHDAFRGEGSFSKAVAGIKTLQNHRIAVTVRVTIHKKNVRELDAIAKYLLEEIGLPGFSTNSASHMGLCRKNMEQIQLNVEEQFIAMSSLLRLNKQYKECISANAGPLADAKNWMLMERSRRAGKEKIPGRGCLVACGPIFNKIAVRADGTIIPCCQIGHIKLGRINQDNLKEIWNNHPELKRLRERRSVSLKDFAFCEGCDYINYCTGNCPALAYTLTGSDFHPSPDGCLKRYLEQGGKIPEEV
jgi:SynChlorMet cassette radical SAM/SPASM protein ScmE